MGFEFRQQPKGILVASGKKITLLALLLLIIASIVYKIRSEIIIEGGE
jgi:hypothetical protein